MQVKLILSTLFIFCMLYAIAQKPIRKGMLPVMVAAPPPQRAYYKLEQLSGKWQEVKRTPVGNKEGIDFSDTLLMQFDSNQVEIKDAISMRMTMRGDAYIDPPYNLVAAGDEYIIRSVNKDRLVLEDGVNTKEMQKKDKFYFETLGKLKVVGDTISTAVNVDTKNLEGKWNVYRRQALAGSVDDSAVVIKSLEIFPSNTIGSAMGRVVCYQSDYLESYSCRIIFGNSFIDVISDKYVWDFKTYKADGKEFVFGVAGRMLYYAKH